MRTLLSCTLLFAGALLIAFALAAADQIGPGLFQFFSCTPADRSIWALIGGMAASVGGVGGLLHEPGPPPVRFPNEKQHRIE